LSRRLLLIMNPVAARTSQAAVRTATAVLADEGWDVEVASTTRPGHAGELAEAAAAAGVERIAVYGGDGTTMQAVRGMLEHGVDLPVGLIPGGTGNLLAGNLRLPRHPAKAARIVARGRTRAIDLGRMQRAEGVRYFAVACGAGFDAHLMASTTSSAKRRWKMGAYFARAWQSRDELRNVAYRITVDGDLLEGDAATVMVANCGEFIPPFVRFRQRATFDDGLFDVVMLRASGLRKTLGVMWSLFRGVDRDQENIRYARGQVVTVEMDPVRPVQFDGEAAGETPFTAELLPGALKVLVPALGASEA